MKPRTRIQKEVVRLTNGLPELTDKQKAYAFEHCFKHHAYRTKGGTITCSECGHRWKGGHTLEVYGLAIHYYLEDELDADLHFTNSVSIVSNQFIDLTEEEKAEAKQAAIAQYQREQLSKMQSRKKKVSISKTDVQPSLFDF